MSQCRSLHVDVCMMTMLHCVGVLKHLFFDIGTPGKMHTSPPDRKICLMKRMTYQKEYERHVDLFVCMLLPASSESSGLRASDDVGCSLRCSLTA